ncbi:hypothetical protein ACWGN5_35725, partial [Streptomyces sp. NPDC055815]
AGRNLAVRGESRGHQWGGKWPPMGSLSWPPSYAVSLERVQEALGGISTSLAGRRRDAAAELIAGGYTG